MFKAYLSSLCAMSVIVGSMGLLAYQLGRFNAQIATQMVNSMVPVPMEARKGNTVYPFPVKANKKHKVMIAEE